MRFEMKIFYLLERIEQKQKKSFYNIPSVLIIHWSKRIRSVKTVRQISNTDEDVIVGQTNNNRYY